MNLLLDKLRKNGYRITNPTLRILESIQTVPQSVATIKDALGSRGIMIDQATLYRVLDRLVKLGIVGKTYFQNTTAMYEIIHGVSHHHHLVCNSCGSVSDIEMDEQKLFKSIKSPAGFLIQNHRLEFFGLCFTCRKKGL